ncbi:MAG: hisA/hisF family protein [Planctomycetota bacterium]|nr:MAG: hisA/hisF family protein [Planctomycetota bacterium]
MRVIPVLDLMGGQIVRGVGGQRDHYRAIESRLCADARPESVAKAFVSLGFRQAYLADLDAIQQGAHAASFATYGSLLQAGLDLWVDAGLQSAAQARRLVEFEAGGRAISGIVAGLESLAGPRTLFAIGQVVEPRRLIFSLDLKHGKPLVGAGWAGLSPMQIAALALRAGVRRMIVLDLASVGMGAGVGTEPLCRRLSCLDSRLEIVGGGGVRSMADLDVLERAGCNSALVASALHDGRLSPRACAARSNGASPPLGVALFQEGR